MNRNFDAGVGQWWDNWFDVQMRGFADVQMRELVDVLI